MYQAPSRLIQWTPHAGCAMPVGADSWSGSGVPCKIEASTRYRVPSQVTSTVPCVGGASGAARMVPMPRMASKPSDTSTACRAPLPAQQVRPDVVRQDQYRRLARTHEVARHGEDEVGVGTVHRSQEGVDHLHCDVGPAGAERRAPAPD